MLEHIMIAWYIGYVVTSWFCTSTRELAIKHGIATENEVTFNSCHWLGAIWPLFLIMFMIMDIKKE